MTLSRAIVYMSRYNKQFDVLFESVSTTYHFTITEYAP